MNNLNILYEDNHIIVVIKQPGILSQADNTKDMDMLTLIKKYIKVKYNKPGNVYLGLVHRLDRMVGGIMVFAKTSKAASRLNEQIKNKIITKRYICIVKGILNRKEGLLEDYLIKDEEKKISKIDSNGKLAQLEYKVIDEDLKNNLSLININLITGRYNQIRVQLSNFGYPILGDNKYDKKPVKTNIRLYAYKLIFNHPITKQEMSFINYPNWKEFSKSEIFKNF